MTEIYCRILSIRDYHRPQSQAKDESSNSSLSRRRRRRRRGLFVQLLVSVGTKNEALVTLLQTIIILRVYILLLLLCTGKG